MASYEFKHVRVPASLPMRPDASVDAEMERVLGHLAAFGWEIKGMWLYEQSGGSAGGKYGYFHEVFLQRLVETDALTVMQPVGRVRLRTEAHPAGPTPVITAEEVFLNPADEDPEMTSDVDAVDDVDLPPEKNPKYTTGKLKLVDICRILGVTANSVRRYQQEWHLDMERELVPKEELHGNFHNTGIWRYVLDAEKFWEWKWRVWDERQARRLAAMTKNQLRQQQNAGGLKE